MGRLKFRYPKNWALRAAVYRRAGFKCQICGRAAEGEIPADYDGRQCLGGGKGETMWILEIDHIHPRFHGGTNELSNLQTLCNSCNARKRHHLPGIV